MTYKFKALGVAAALALAPMAASAATLVDIKIQSFGELGSLTTSPVSNPDIAGALAARDAFIGGANILAFEGFETFIGCTGFNSALCDSTAGGLDTAVGTFNVSGNVGTGDTIAPVDQAVVKRAEVGVDSGAVADNELGHIMGRYNVAIDGAGNHEGGHWLDSNDMETIEWSIPGMSGLTKFDRIAFFLTDVNDSGNVRFDISVDGKTITGDPTISGNRTNGLLNLVTMQFNDFVTGNVLISMTNTSGNRSDGWGVDSITVAAVPLPAAGWLMIAGLGGLAALRRRKRAA